MEERDAITEQIIGCAIEVHRGLGPGLLESAYEAAMSIELATKGLQFERQRLILLLYRDIRIGSYRLDLIVESRVLLEIKSAQRYDPVFAAQVLTYLRVSGLHIGLLVNF